MFSSFPAGGVSVDGHWKMAGPSFFLSQEIGDRTNVTGIVQQVSSTRPLYAGSFKQFIQRISGPTCDEQSEKQMECFIPTLAARCERRNMYDVRVDEDNDGNG